MSMTPECTEAMIRHLLDVTRQALEPLDRALDLVPDDRLGERPVPEQRPVGSMIEHAFSSVAFTSRAIRMGKCEEADVADLMKEDDETGTRPRIREIASLARTEVDAVLEGLDIDAATRTIDYWFGFKLTSLETALLGYQELCHHRGQVQCMLRLMGYEPPDIYAPVEAAESREA